jgi:hypothetical protein
MRTTLPIVMIICLFAAACAAPPRYQVLDRPTGDFTGYGSWEVSKVQIATHIPHNWAGRSDMEDWRKRVQKAAEFIGEETKRMLDDYRTDGKPMRVQIKMMELKPAKGWGGVGQAGDLKVHATFVDSKTGKRIGKCEARNFPTADPFVDPTRYLDDIAEVFVAFVKDHSQ